MSLTLAKIKLREAERALACAQSNLAGAAALLPEQGPTVTAAALRFMGAALEEHRQMLEELISHA